MSIDVIENRLQRYNCKSRMDEINALKEITQEIALMALSKAGFFKVAEFHGGTALRILHGVQRFSEDLDFALIKPMSDFDLMHYLTYMHNDFEAYGYKVQMADRKDASKIVQKQFLKVDSLGKELSLMYPQNKSERRIKIKIELDTNPPAGAKMELQYLTFPLAFSVLAKDLPSSFAGKLHAILCRPFDKGRDWYDFIWYISNRVPVNFDLLSNALEQQGPWAGSMLKADKHWLADNLRRKVLRLKWSELVQDIMPLLQANEQQALETWDEAFFLHLISKGLEA